MPDGQIGSNKSQFSAARAFFCSFIYINCSIIQYWANHLIIYIVCVCERTNKNTCRGCLRFILVRYPIFKAVNWCNLWFSLLLLFFGRQPSSHCIVYYCYKEFGVHLLTWSQLTTNKWQWTWHKWTNFKTTSFILI